jgi:hypothetical protein
MAAAAFLINIQILFYDSISTFTVLGESGILILTPLVSMKVLCIISLPAARIEVLSILLALFKEIHILRQKIAMLPITCTLNRTFLIFYGKSTQNITP